MRYKSGISLRFLSTSVFSRRSFLRMLPKLMCLCPSSIADRQTCEGPFHAQTSANKMLGVSAAKRPEEWQCGRTLASTGMCRTGTSSSMAGDDAPDLGYAAPWRSIQNPGRRHRVIHLALNFLVRGPNCT